MLRGMVRKQFRLETERLTLRAPEMKDFAPWVNLRRESREFLEPWEPTWTPTHLSKQSFVQRVNWARTSFSNGSAYPFFIFHRNDDLLLGAITLDNVRRGPSQSGILGYWVGQPFIRQGYMRESIGVVVHHAFAKLDLSRIEAACLPENVASRGVLEKSGFKYEGVAQSYLEINGRWRNHVLYAALRLDRRGKAEV